MIYNPVEGTYAQRVDAALHYIVMYGDRGAVDEVLLAEGLSARAESWGLGGGRINTAEISLWEDDQRKDLVELLIRTNRALLANSSAEERAAGLRLAERVRVLLADDTGPITLP